MERKHIQVNGFRAEVLSEGYTAILRTRNNFSRYRVAHEADAAPTKAQREQFLADADAGEFDEVVVSRHLHVKYDLRCTMRSRSGSLVFMTTFRKNTAGKWFSEKSSTRSIY
jgi:hypothetical protein